MYLKNNNNLLDLNDVEFPRCFVLSHFVNPKREQIAFCDASEVGIGYVIYMKTTWNEEVHVCLVTAGSRVIPRTANTMLRLELCSAVELL